MNMNSNLSQAEYERIVLDRANARYARKVINRERYKRRYTRIHAQRVRRQR